MGLRANGAVRSPALYALAIVALACVALAVAMRLTTRLTTRSQPPATRARAANATARPPSAWVWWEGERPLQTNFPDTSSLGIDTLPAEARAELSYGDWLTVDGKREPGNPEAYATYAVRVPGPAVYRVWARKSGNRVAFRWRFDGRVWQTSGPDAAQVDSVRLRTPLSVSWLYLGELRLTEGGHTFELELLAKPGEDTVAGFDAFIATSSAFAPNGRLRPGEGPLDSPADRLRSTLQPDAPSSDALGHIVPGAPAMMSGR